jgi:hypothetical protein
MKPDDHTRRQDEHESSTLLVGMKTKLEQVKFEKESWKRLLDYIKQEKVIAREHISQLVKDAQYDPHFLNAVENYLDDLLRLETVATLIKSDISAFENLLECKFMSSQELETILRNRQKLNHNVQQLEQRFKQINSSFDSYIIS